MSLYNAPGISYNNATTPYNGAPVNYTYAGAVTVFFSPNHNLQFNHLAVNFLYNGSATVEFVASSMNASGRSIVPETDGVRVLFAPSSTTVIRKFLKLKDPVRTGGCPQCGTFLYNRRG